MRLDLAGRNGAAQRLLDAGDALGRLFHLARIDDDAAAAGALGLVERGLGLVDQDLGGLVAGIEQRAADRGRQPRRALADIVGRRQDLDQHLGLFAGRFLAEHHRQQEGEFVGADAGHGRLAVHRRAQPHRHLDQDVVAGLVAEQIVDRLEAVEVENADGKRRRIVGAVGDQAVDLVEEPPHVAEPGQRIGEGQIRSLPAGLAAAKHHVHSSSCLVRPFARTHGSKAFRKRIARSIFVHVLRERQTSLLAAVRQ